MDEFTSPRKEHKNGNDVVVDPPRPTMRSDEASILNDGVVIYPKEMLI